MKKYFVSGALLFLSALALTNSAHSQIAETRYHLIDITPDSFPSGLRASVIASNMRSASVVGQDCFSRYGLTRQEFSWCDGRVVYLGADGSEINLLEEINRAGYFPDSVAIADLNESGTALGLFEDNIFFTFNREEGLKLRRARITSTGVDDFPTGRVVATSAKIDEQGTIYFVQQTIGALYDLATFCICEDSGSGFVLTDIVSSGGNELPRLSSPRFVDAGKNSALVESSYQYQPANSTLLNKHGYLIADKSSISEFHAFKESNQYGFRAERFTVTGSAVGTETDLEDLAKHYCIVFFNSSEHSIKSCLSHDQTFFEAGIPNLLIRSNGEFLIHAQEISSGTDIVPPSIITERGGRIPLLDLVEDNDEIDSILDLYQFLENGDIALKYKNSAGETRLGIYKRDIQPTDIYFINGIMMDELDSEYVTLNIANILADDDRFKRLTDFRIYSLYNPSSGSFYSDLLVESVRIGNALSDIRYLTLKAAQRYLASSETELSLQEVYVDFLRQTLVALEQSRPEINAAPFRELIDETSFSDENQRHVILLGYSQGNFYANILWDTFDNEKLEFLEILGMASPDSQSAGRVENAREFLVTERWDIIQNVPGALRWTVHNGLTQEENKRLDTLGHDIYSIYLKEGTNTREALKDIIYRALISN